MVSLTVVMSAYDKWDVEKSLENLSAQTLTDMEIICIDRNGIMGGFHDENVTVKESFDADDINGDYVYFLNSGDMLEKYTFKLCYDICEEKDLDFVQFDSEEKFDDEVYSLADLRAKTFQMDMKRNTRFFKSRFIKGLGEISDIDYLFFWDCIFNAKRFSFIGIEFSPKMFPVDFTKQIEDTNRVFVKFAQADYLGKYKFAIFDWRIETLYGAYLDTPDDMKEECYNALKQDFTQMIYHWRFLDFCINVIPINKLFFDDVVYSKGYEEFEKLMVQYDLELDTLKVEKENEIIEKNIRFLQNENDLILNSTSWKITEPLRKLK